MIIFKIAHELQLWLESLRKSGKTIGFAPTMGALHAGHISLINESKKQADVTVSSIFINPTQFNNTTDFEKYPVSLEDDILLLEKAGCDAVLIPSVDQIYPDGLKSESIFELGDLEKILEGAFRPGHYQGVAQVVKKLLEITRPDKIFIGQKDFQQCLVIKKLIASENIKTDVVICPTLRENDGLAMSSRNRRLNSKQRAIAPAIFKALTYISKNIHELETEKLKTSAIDMLTGAGLKVDYIEIATIENLEPAKTIERGENYIVLAAAFADDIRLIDNLIV